MALVACCLDTRGKKDVLTHSNTQHHMCCCCCCCCEIKGTQDLDIYSHADSLILSLSHTRSLVAVMKSKELKAKTSHARSLILSHSITGLYLNHYLILNHSMPRLRMCIYRPTVAEVPVSGVDWIAPNAY